MRIRNFLSILSAAALLAAPTVAVAANPAAPLSVSSSARASAPAGKSKFLGGPGSTIGLILFAAVIAGGIWLAVDDDNGPDSP